MIFDDNEISNRSMSIFIIDSTHSVLKRSLLSLIPCLFKFSEPWAALLPKQSNETLRAPFLVALLRGLPCKTWMWSDNFSRRGFASSSSRETFVALLFIFLSPGWQFVRVFRFFRSLTMIKCLMASKLRAVVTLVRRAHSHTDRMIYVKCQIWIKQRCAERQLEGWIASKTIENSKRLVILEEYLV